MKKLFIMLGLLLPLLLSAATYSLKISLEAPASFTEEAFMASGYGFITAPGCPRLPYKTVNILLPSGVELLSQSSRLSGLNRISAPEPQLNPGYISSEGLLDREGSFEPQNRVHCLGLKKWGELSYLSYRVLPAAYENGAWQWEDSFSVNIEHTEPERMGQRLPATFSDRAFFANPETLERWYNTSAYRELYYLVISSPELYQAAAPLIDYRSNYVTSFMDIATILQSFPGANGAEKVRNFLIQFSQAHSLIYVLLIGDVDVVPTAYLCPEPNGYETVASDFYYSDLTSIWDTDSDGRLGEYYAQEGEEDWLVDYTPECFVGRISTNNPAQVTAICNRTVAYEQSTAAWKQKVLLPAAFLNYHDEPELGLLQTDGATYSEYLTNTILNEYQTTTMYERLGYLPSYDSDLDLDYNTLKDQLSSQSWGILNWSAHGSATSSSRKVWMNDDNFNNLPDNWEMEWQDMVDRESFDNLVNQDGLVLFAASCNNGMLDGNYTSLGEYSLIKKTVGTIAGTRTGWYKVGWRNPGWGGLSSYNYHWLENFTANRMSMGVAQAYANLLHTQIYLFGDPADSGGIIYPELQNIYTYMLFGDPALGEPNASTYPTRNFLIYEPSGDSGYRLQNALHAMQTAYMDMNNLNVVYTDVLIPVGSYNPQSYLSKFSAIFCLFNDEEDPYFLMPGTDDYSQLLNYLEGGGSIYLEGPGNYGSADPFWDRFRMHQPLNTVVPISEINYEGPDTGNWDYTGTEMVSPFVLLPEGDTLFWTLDGETGHILSVFTLQLDGSRTIGSLFRLAGVEEGENSYQEMVEVLVQYLIYGYFASNNEPLQPRLRLSSYPNPFNPSTRIAFELATAGRTTLKLYNLRGQLLSELLNTQLAAGAHELQFEGRDQAGRSLSSGIYFLRLEQGGKSQSL
ncbi:MAG: C25 family cysteine peptidase, partial [Candidatus Cloacimonadota bacterium]